MKHSCGICIGLGAVLFGTVSVFLLGQLRRPESSSMAITNYKSEDTIKIGHPVM
jgi:hypothetical protein